MNIDAELDRLRAAGNFRHIPRTGAPEGVTDLSGNDYLGAASRIDLRRDFLASADPALTAFSSSASRLLADCQECYSAFEDTLADAYGHGRAALLFNSGYHANTGLVSALGSRRTLIVADRLVHASIIDGIMLAKCDFERFPHNNIDRLEAILERKAADYDTVAVIVESVYSMDGDSPDLRRLAELRRRYESMLLYVDEAHGVGVCGPEGLGMVDALGLTDSVDVLVGTLGKALASVGAYAILSPAMRDFMVNRSRSLIFSTSLPPVNVEWSRFVFNRMRGMHSERAALADLSRRLSAVTGAAPSHIQPLITGSAHTAVELSRLLLDEGFKVLPIRTPTVPPGTERLRFSLSAAIPPAAIDRLATVLPPLLGRFGININQPASTSR